MKRPTNSQISTPSKLPVVTSNKLVMAFFIHGFPLLKRRDFLACFIMEVLSFEMLSNLKPKIMFGQVIFLKLMERNLQCQAR